MLTEGSSYAVGVTVEVGADLGLDIKKVVSLGLHWSVAVTKTQEETQGVEVSCPKGPWQCSLAIWPGMVKVKGTKTYTDGIKDMVSCSEKTEDYEVDLPIKEDNKLAPVRIRPCACPNREHWADPGAPDRCPSDCDG